MINATENKIITPEQLRAKAAWKVTKEMSGDSAKDFSSLCKQTTSRIHNSGIMPTLAFLDAKTKENDKEKSGPAGQMRKCMEAVVAWLAQFVNCVSKTDCKKMLEMLMDADAVTLRRVQSEALAYLEWLARFAEGRAGSDEKGKEGGAE